MKQLCAIRFFTLGLLRPWGWLACLLAGLWVPAAQAADTFDATHNILTIPLVVVGNTAYSNVRISVGAVLSIGAGSPTSSVDSFNPITNQLTIPSVTVGSLTYTNVVITIGAVLGIGAATSIHAAPVLALVNPLPDATVGQSYSANVVAAVAPPSRYTYTMDTLANGALPGGFTLDINGALSGRATATGRTDLQGNQAARSYTFGICATDTITRVMTTPCPQTSITVNPAPVACTYTYSGWSVCAAGQQARSVLSTTPANCNGTPVTTQACTTAPPASSACYYCQFDVSCRVFGFGGCWRCSTSTVVAGNCLAPSTALVTYGSTCVADPALYQVCQ